MIFKSFEKIVGDEVGTARVNKTKVSVYSSLNKFNPLALIGNENEWKLVPSDCRREHSSTSV